MNCLCKKPPKELLKYTFISLCWNLIEKTKEKNVVPVFIGNSCLFDNPVIYIHLVIKVLLLLYFIINLPLFSFHLLLTIYQIKYKNRQSI